MQRPEPAAAPLPPAVPPVAFREASLGNGLRVILHRDGSVPLVHVTLHYGVGSSFEQPGQSGFAHLFEHMMFQGSRLVGKNEHGRLLDAAGGRWNATTSKDRTNYYATVPSHQLELALWLEADRMLSLEVTEENFDNQRQTVIEEKKQSYDNRPYGLAYLRFDELAYQNWAYAHPIIGSVQDLQRATREDAEEFHRTFYGPGNAVLAISGDFQESRVLDTVERYFGVARNQSQPSSPDLFEPPQEAEKREVLEDPLALLPAVYIGYHMPRLGSPEFYALSMLTLILSQGESSRLYRRLVYEHNWITSLSAGPNQYRGPQLFVLWYQVQQGVATAPVLEAIEEEIERMCAEPVSDQELEKARNQVLHRFVAARGTLSGIGEGLARYTLLLDGPERINREVHHYLDVGAAEIRETARRVFRSSNRSLIEVMPSAAGPEIS